MKTAVVLLIYFPGYISTYSGTRTCIDTRLNSHNKLDHNQILSIADIGPFACWNECLTRARCLSVNFGFQSHLCELNSEASHLSYNYSSYVSFNKDDFQKVRLKLKVLICTLAMSFWGD